MTSRRFDKGNRDANEKQIEEVIQRYNIPYRKGSDSDGYDLLVLLSPVRLVEVKNPTQPPAKRRLTETESETKEWCDSNGIPYDVVETPEQMAEIVANARKVPQL